MALIGFPNPVNELAARTVAAGVAAMALVTLLTGWHPVIALMAVGFAARVLSGPTLSVLGQIATRVVAPRLGMPRFVPGPPKRFAQAIGLTLTTIAAVGSLVFGARLLAAVLIAVLLVFALLESVLGFCAGCWLFGRLMALGVIPTDVCEACANVSFSADAPLPGRAH